MRDPSTWRGLAETTLVVSAFVGFGLACAGLAGSLRGPPGPERSTLDSAWKVWTRIPPPAPSRGRAEARSRAGPRWNGVEAMGRCATPSIWLLDGFNVLQTGLLAGRDRREWWTEPRRAELLDLAARFDDLGAEIWVVFDGQRPERAEDPPDGESSARVRCVFTPSADEWLLARVRAAANPASITVVTRDRKVAERARHRGAQVCSPRAFLERCSD